jgi:hypothetical protein
MSINFIAPATAGGAVRICHPRKQIPADWGNFNQRPAGPAAGALIEVPLSWRA